MARRNENDKPGKPNRRRKRSEPVSWSDVDPGTITGFIELAEELDGAVRFGRSRDGCVYSIGFYLGDDRFTEWVRGIDDVDLEFKRLHDEISEDYGL